MSKTLGCTLQCVDFCALNVQLDHVRERPTIPFNNRVESPFAGTYLVVSKGGFFADALASLLGQSILAAPSFTLRGGTREILRSIIGKSLAAA